MSARQEANWIDRLRVGERDAFGRMYERYKADVLALVATMLGDKEAAWDVLHDVFVSLARNARHLDPQTNLKGYLLTAGANRARDVLSKRRATPLDADRMAVLSSRASDEPPILAARREEADRLWQSISSLPAEQRLVLALHIYGGLTFRQIAEQEQLSENTVQSRYRYALDKMRQTFRSEEVLHEHGQ